MKRLGVCAVIIFLLCGRAFGAPTAVTVTGTVHDTFGNASVGTRVGIYPINPTAQESDLIMANPVETQTDSSGNFTLHPAGAVYSAFFIQGNANTPTTLIRTTLPASGTVTLSELLTQSSNVVTSFPPISNLNMDGFTFLNMLGASIAGEPVVEGSGLAGGTMFSSTGTFAIPANSSYIVATLFAAGGGGGGGNAGTNGGGGGGGGQVLQCLMLPVNGTIAVTIGAPGTAGAVTPTDGGNAADTTVSQSSAATICDAGGGAGGIKGTGGGGGAGGAGGNAATEITGAAMQMFMTAGLVGAAGSAGAGGAGAGLSKFGGTGGNPSAAGLIGPAAHVLIRAY